MTRPAPGVKGSPPPGQLAAPTFPPGANPPAFIPGRPNNAGPLLKDPVIGATPYNGKTGPFSAK